MWKTVDKLVIFRIPTYLKDLIPIFTALIVIGYFFKNIIYYILWQLLTWKKRKKM
jgi:hypothetical protein